MADLNKILKCKLFKIVLFIIGCFMIYYGYSIACCQDLEKINNIPWSWIILIGLFIVIFTGYKLIKQ